VIKGLSSSDPFWGQDEGMDWRLQKAVPLIHGSHRAAYGFFNQGNLLRVVLLCVEDICRKHSPSKKVVSLSLFPLRAVHWKPIVE